MTRDGRRGEGGGEGSRSGETGGGADDGGHATISNSGRSGFWASDKNDIPRPCDFMGESNEWWLRADISSRSLALPLPGPDTRLAGTGANWAPGGTGESDWAPGGASECNWAPGSMKKGGGEKQAQLGSQ